MQNSLGSGIYCREELLSLGARASRPHKTWQGRGDWLHRVGRFTRRLTLEQRLDKYAGGTPALPGGNPWLARCRSLSKGVILQEHSAPISCPTPNFAKGLFTVPYWACFEGMGEQTALGALWLVFFPSARTCSLEWCSGYALRSRARAEGKNPAPFSRPPVRNAGSRRFWEGYNLAGEMHPVQRNSLRCAFRPSRWLPGCPG